MNCKSKRRLVGDWPHSSGEIIDDSIPADLIDLNKFIELVIREAINQKFEVVFLHIERNWDYAQPKHSV